MSKAKKKHIDTYTTIYPVEIVIANESVQLEDLKKLYTFSDGTELNDSITDAIASTSTCTRKSDNCPIVLIKFCGKKDGTKIDLPELIGDIAHESLHATLDIFDYLNEGICYTHQEPVAYLIGFISTCAYNTLVKK